MRPWSPDEFVAEIESVANAATAAGVATATLEAPFDMSTAPEERVRDFVEDFPKEGLDGFMRRLSKTERDQLVKLVEDGIRNEIERELEADRARERAEQAAVLHSLHETLGRRVEDELHTVSRNAVELAIAMAEQIIRREVAVDKAVLLKSIETIIYRADRGTRFKLIASPDDVEFLRSHQEVLEELNISEVNPDRRIERGGCIISAEGQEWDYTLGGRFESLAEVVRNSMADCCDGEEGA